MESYTTVRQEAAAEFIEKRSRFVGAVKPVKSEAEANGFLDSIQSKHWDASHNCYAYTLKGNVQRYSDDGEPQGTAGVPILEILRREHVVDAIIVVTRYFGGTLLGAGGLVRAYSHTAKLALETAGKLVMRPCTVFSVRAPYQIYDRVNLMLQRRGVTVLDSDFGEAVTLILRIPSVELPIFMAELTELSGGSIDPIILCEEYA